MLPKGWRRSSIGECAKLLSGNTPSKENPEYWSGDFPWVTVKDMKTPWIYSTGLGLTQPGKAASSIAPANSILVVTRGMALLKDLPISMAMRDVAFNQDIKAIVPKDYLDSRFFALQLQSRKHDVLGLVDTAGHGTGKLDTDLLKSVEIVLPPLPEQHRIAKILATWDQAIAATERLMTTTVKQKTGLMQKLLTGKGRLQGFIEPWTEYSLGHLFSERVETARHELLLLSITRDEGVIPREDVGRKDTSNDDKSKYQRIYVGDIGYNTMRMWQGVSALSEYEGIISPAYTVIVPGKLIDGKFASYLFKFQPIIFLFYRHSQGLVSDTWNLKYPHFAKIKVLIPDVQEQRAIAEILETVDEQLTAIDLMLKRLKEEKAALMSQLLTGKRRVRMSEAEMETKA